MLQRLLAALGWASAKPTPPDDGKFRCPSCGRMDSFHMEESLRSDREVLRIEDDTWDVHVGYEQETDFNEQEIVCSCGFDVTSLVGEVFCPGDEGWQGEEDEEELEPTEGEKS